MVNNVRNNTISEISGKKGLNKLNKIKHAAIIKYKKCTPKQKELLNLFNDLLDTILTDETLKSKCQKDKTLISSKDENENEKRNKLLNNDNNPNAKNKKTSTNTKEAANKKKKNDENRNILLEYREDVDDRLFKNTVTIKILTVL